VQILLPLFPKCISKIGCDTFSGERIIFYQQYSAGCQESLQKTGTVFNLRKPRIWDGSITSNNLSRCSVWRHIKLGSLFMDHEAYF
jgi:hypothetical protein